MKAEAAVFDVPNVKSLVWDGDDLVDWVAVGRRISLNGEVRSLGVNYTYRFDAAITSPSGRYTALYERLGTKALLLKRGEIVRELNRSHYCADDYEYPIAFLTLRDGSEAIAHCPQDYCRIDIEVAATGRCLTDSAKRDPKDVFHSRLSAGPGGSFLASAGWIWHPFGIACLWPVEAVLADPTRLDASAVPLSISGEVESVAFVDAELLAVAIGNESFGEGHTEGLGILRVADGSLIRFHPFPFSLGTLVSFGPDHVLTLHDHPRLINVKNGTIEMEWPDLDTGKQTSSIIHHLDPLPPFAKHPDRPMFAVADTEKVTVVTVT
jgi:hypothetical protein